MMGELGSKQIVAGVSDLMFTSKIAQTAKHVGATVEFASSAEKLLAKVSPATALVIVDLNLKALDPVALIRALKNDPDRAAVPLAAYVNHECTDLIKGAREAGCDEVLTRGAFSSGLPELLSR
jgi:CheY-like chemotaxis protein